MRRNILFLLTLFLCLAPAYAQKRKAKVAKVTKPIVVEKTPEQKLYEELLPSTAKVMFIDSIVVDKNDFLSYIPMPQDMGTMVTDGQSTAYVNEFGNTQILASGDSINGRHLFMAHRYGEQWDDASLLSELDMSNPDYPFLMSNGVTLYFSATGEGTVGGRDIFMTNYDADNAKFYEATNMGLPFNSPDNEYLLAISDMDNLGWLVTDRRQPEGKVCIYTFVPTEQRQAFDEDTDEAILKSYAEINSIKDTWKFGDIDNARSRVSAMNARMKTKKEEDIVYFIVNDSKTITSLSEFKNTDNANLYKEIASSKSKLKQMNKVLETTRESYINATGNKRYSFGRQIVTLEKELSELELDIKSAEKRLRANENK